MCRDLTFVQVETLCVKLWLAFEMRAKLDLRLTKTFHGPVDAKTATAKTILPLSVQLCKSVPNYKVSICHLGGVKRFQK